jgi:hypothetical protein
MKEAPQAWDMVEETDTYLLDLAMTDPVWAMADRTMYILGLKVSCQEQEEDT